MEFHKDKRRKFCPVSSFLHRNINLASSGLVQIYTSAPRFVSIFNLDWLDISWYGNPG